MGEEVVVSLWSLAAARPGVAKFRGKLPPQPLQPPVEWLRQAGVSSCLFLECRKEGGKQETNKDELEILRLWIQIFLWQLNCKINNNNKKNILPTAGGTVLNTEQNQGSRRWIFKFLIG